MKIFFDTEFTGLHQGTKLISIGLIDENGRSFYAESNYFNNGFYTFDDEKWIVENVVPSLTMYGKNNGNPIIQYGDGSKSKVYGYSECIKDNLEIWLSGYGQVEMWSDCLSYDWVLFNQLWGHAFKIPKNVYYIPFDICTMFKLKGIDPDINREEFAGMTDGAEKHNALWDARIIKACYEKMMSS